ncbi:DUF3005 domain-containing protein [Paraburkholderia ferrariae]|jgi:hypothetical protein|uniref:DUF3005 domain-containing protein n=1 Tax=Paraburkholderia ferrariae TaxID=386056 RepID=UPI00069465DC|nr:DUF3005 domain-containing protein [Paraburkholderia ferrariae]
MKRTDRALEQRRELAALVANANMSPDEATTTDATLDNSMPEAGDGIAGFDSRPGGHRLLFALQPGYEVLDKGMTSPLVPYTADWEFVDSGSTGTRRSPGRLHYSLNHLRPSRIVELQRKG